MNTIQQESKKIKKGPKIDPTLPRDFICGGCGWTYASYPALACHIRRKHDGIMPPGTILQKPIQSSPHRDIKGGRPNKPKKDLDEINDKQMRLEEAHNDLVSLLAEKMYLTGDMGPKISLESIFVKVQDTNINQTDKWLNDLQEGSKVFVEEYKVRDENLEHLDFEGEFRQLDPKKSLDVIVWFMMWVAKVYVRPEFIPEVCLILSRIWKVLDESQLNAQDLDNKLIWKRGMQECEELIAILPAFKNDKGLLKDFIQNVCQLIGKTFDEDDSSSESSYERV